MGSISLTPAWFATSSDSVASRVAIHRPTGGLKPFLRVYGPAWETPGKPIAQEPLAKALTRVFPRQVDRKQSRQRPDQ